MSNIVISEERDSWKALYSNAREVTPLPSKSESSEEEFTKASKRRNAANFLCQVAWERNLDPAALLADHDFANHAANCAALNDLKVRTPEDRRAGASQDIPASTINRFERLSARTGNKEAAGTDRFTISEQCRKMQKQLRDAPGELAGQFLSKFVAKDTAAVEASTESLATATEEVDVDF